MANIKKLDGKEFIKLYNGTTFTKIAGDEKKALFYNSKLNNLLIVAADEQAEQEMKEAQWLTQQLIDGQLDEDEVELDENDKVVVDLSDESFTDTTEEVIGFLTPDRWLSLCETVESSYNATVLLHKPYHTTTDYIINFDLKPSGLLEKSAVEALETFEQSLPEMIPYKTTEVINGQAYPHN